jgi:hypothetical protein
MSVNWFALWGWGKIGPGWIGWSADVLSFASFRMVSPVLLGCLVAFGGCWVVPEALQLDWGRAVWLSPSVGREFL